MGVKAKGSSTGDERETPHNLFNIIDSRYYVGKLKGSSLKVWENFR